MAELLMLSADRIQELAREPLAFDVPSVSTRCDQAATDWREAFQRVVSESEAGQERRAAGNGAGKLNRTTLDFIRDGAGTGERHRLLFSAAANLAEPLQRFTPVNDAFDGYGKQSSNLRAAMAQAWEASR